MKRAPVNIKILLPIVGAVIAFITSLSLQAFLPPAVIKDDMPGGAYRAEGLFDPPGNAQGFYDPERLSDGTTYRWTRPQAAITFPYAAHAGRHARLRLRVAANWAPGQKPENVVLKMNGEQALTFEADREFRLVEASLDTQRLPNPYLHPAHVQVDLISGGSSVAGDPRQFGIVVDWAELFIERSRTETLVSAGVWAVVVAVTLGLALGRVSTGSAITFGAALLLTLVLLQVTYIPRAIAPAVEYGLAGLAWIAALLAGKGGRAVWGLALGVSLASVLVAGRAWGDWQMDDAYISFRYAWNLVHGNGLVYNLGEPVEGYTNFLWTVLSAGAIGLGLPPAGFMLAANIALSIGLLALTYHLALKLAAGEQWWALLATVLLAFDVAVITYGARGSGMEAMFSAFLTLLSVMLLWSGADRKVTGSRIAAGMVLAMGALTRPEGLMVAAIFLIVRAWQDRQIKFAVLRLASAALLPMLAILVPYHAWRLLFYGYPLPNTFYAKAGFTFALLERGYEYLFWFWYEHYLVATLVVSALIVALVGWLLPGRKPSSTPKPDSRAGLRLSLGILIVAQTIYVLFVGGDFFPGWRFFVVIVAPMSLLAIDVVRVGFRHLSLGAVPLASARALLLLVSALYVGQSLWLQRMPERPSGIPSLAELTKLHSTYVDRWGSAGLWLREGTPPSTLTAVKGAGAIAYYSERPVLDAHGLNDLHIAHLDVSDMGARRAGHEKEDPVYVLDRRPEYILDLEVETYMAPVEKRLRDEYRYMLYRSPTGVEIGWWVRKDLAR